MAVERTGPGAFLRAVSGSDVPLRNRSQPGSGIMAKGCGRRVARVLFVSGLLQVAAAGPAHSQTPQIVAERASQFKLDTAGTGAGQITQFALGPDGRIYASTADRGVESFALRRHDRASSPTCGPHRTSAAWGSGSSRAPARCISPRSTAASTG